MSSLAKSKVEHVAVAEYRNARERCIQKFLTQNNPHKLIYGLSDAMDALIQACVSDELLGNDIAIIATGGYGRRELFPYSDVDILFLTGRPADSIRPLIEHVLYPLWDQHYQVGHVLHDVASACSFARDNITTATALLDARLVAGSQSLFAALQTALHTEWNHAPPQIFIEAKLKERDHRHKKFGDSRYLLEPNIKEGKGGLRDLHTLEWLAKYAYQARDVRDLVAQNVLSSEEAKVFESTRRFLWNLRAHMHIIAGKAEERLTFDMQQKLTTALGYTHSEPHKAVERMMKRYFTNARIVGSLTRIVCALLEDAQKRNLKKSLARYITGLWTLHGFILIGDRLSVKHEDEFLEHPMRMLELFYVAGMQELDIHPHALQLVVRHLKAIDKKFQHDYDACNMFMRIMLEVRDVETTMRRMNDVGLLGKFIPAFGRIMGQTQFNMYHVYTVDEHTLVALGILRAIEHGSHKKELPLASFVATQISHRHVLYVALLCHDIAKGREGDHSEIGEDIARKLALRFEFSEEDSELVAWLVRYHLLMSATAFKRDLHDPKTIQDFVGLVQSATRLRLLLLLTVADIRAVGPQVWNEWKGELIRELYRRAEQYIQTGQIVEDQGLIERTAQGMIRALPADAHPHIAHYLEQNYHNTLAALTADQHARIFVMMREFETQKPAFIMQLQHTEAMERSELIICTPDCSGLFSKLTGALSLAGSNIISAKIFTRKDGMAVDIFQIQGIDGKAFDAPEKYARLNVRIAQVLAGEVDIPSEISKLKASYPRKQDALMQPASVHIDNNASNVFSVIEITSHDRVGLLCDITQQLSALQLSIASAHVSTYGEQAVDVFYVKDNFGHKIVHWTRIKEVRERLLNDLNATGA